MAAPVTALQPLKLAAGPSAVGPDQRYWRSFRSQQLVPSPSPVTHISFPSGAKDPDAFAVTSGGRVRIFSSRTRKVVKTISRFGLDEQARSGEIRSDGRVLAAGSDSGAILVFDVNSRAILKTWKEHKQAVWTVRWSPSSLTSLVSASDDRTVRLWDLPTGESVRTFNGHQDYVRSGCFLDGRGSDLFASGSYDGTVRLWDARASSDAAVMTFRHEAPIEAVLALPSSTTLLSAAGNQISVLDLVAGRPVEIIKSHQKTVTCLSAAAGSRFASGGLDGHVKIFDTTSWRVVGGSKYSSPILSLSIIPGGGSDRHLAVGMQSGVLSLKMRLAGQQKVLERERAKEMEALLEGKIDEYDRQKAKKQKRLPQGVRRKLRGLDYDGADAAIIIEGRERLGKKKKLPLWNQALRASQYARALDEALGQQPTNPVSVFTLLTALQHRSALRAALRGRDETSLRPVLRWLTKHIADPRHVVLTSRVATLVLDLYGEHLGQSNLVDGLVERLHDRVRAQVEGSQVAENTRGMLEMIMAGG